MSKEIILMCSNKAYEGVKGHWDKCEQCAFEIYVSDSSFTAIIQQGFANSEIILLCIKCCFNDDPECLKKAIPLSREQIDDIKKHIKWG